MTDSLFFEDRGTGNQYMQVDGKSGTEYLLLGDDGRPAVKQDPTTGGPVHVYMSADLQRRRLESVDPSVLNGPAAIKGRVITHGLTFPTDGHWTWPMVWNEFRHGERDKELRRKFILVVPKIAAFVAPALVVDLYVPVVGLIDDAMLPLAEPVSSTGVMVMVAYAVGRMSYLKWRHRR